MLYFMVLYVYSTSRHAYILYILYHIYILVADMLYIHTTYIYIYIYAYHDEAAYDLLGVALDREGGAVLAYPLPDLVIPVALVT